MRSAAGVRPRLRSPDVPTLVVRGTADRILPIRVQNGLGGLAGAGDGTRTRGIPLGRLVVSKFLCRTRNSRRRPPEMPSFTAFSAALLDLIWSPRSVTAVVLL